DRVCFDARGAYTPEYSEYRVAGIKKIEEEIESLEKSAVLGSDFRLAVSEKLVQYWRDKFTYADHRYVIIPCTLNSAHLKHEPDASKTRMLRKQMGVKEDEVLLCYSGSTAGWQSFRLMEKFLLSCLAMNTRCKMLFLTDKKIDFSAALDVYRDRLIFMSVAPSEVFAYLSACDYGILLREESMTNKVSSPVKFAEYLLSGLKVIITPNVGDYPAFIRENSCGHIVSREMKLQLGTVGTDEKARIAGLGRRCFGKKAFNDHYRTLLEHLNENT
ncbi:MAG: hypothetical protein AB1458_12940, partial [Bacteroidota bacterium]